jgi:hypothetical protein
MNAPRCRFQFRLRTLLLIVALVAAACPFGVKGVRDWQARRDREAIEMQINPHDLINPNASPEMLKKLAEELAKRRVDSK